MTKVKTQRHIWREYRNYQTVAIASNFPSLLFSSSTSLGRRGVPRRELKGTQNVICGYRPKEKKEMLVRSKVFKQAMLCMSVFVITDVDNFSTLYIRANG